MVLVGQPSTRKGESSLSFVRSRRGFLLKSKPPLFRLSKELTSILCEQGDLSSKKRKTGQESFDQAEEQEQAKSFEQKADEQARELDQEFRPLK